jgi:hypothetical protein
MKRTLLAVALLTTWFASYAQTSAPAPGASTVTQQPGTGTTITTTPGGPVTGSTGAAPIGPGGSSVGQTIQGQPLPPVPSPNSTPNSSSSQPSTLGGTTLQPGVLGSAPPSPGVIGNTPCIGTNGTNPCPPLTQ